MIKVFNRFPFLVVFPIIIPGLFLLILSSILEPTNSDAQQISPAQNPPVRTFTNRPEEYYLKRIDKTLDDISRTLQSIDRRVQNIERKL